MSLSTNNIFSVGLEDKPGEAAELHFRANLVLTLSAIVRDKQWDVTEAAERLKLSKDEVSDLLNRRSEKFTSERLLKCLGDVGHLVTVSYDHEQHEVKAEAAPQLLMDVSS